MNDVFFQVSLFLIFIAFLTWVLYKRRKDVVFEWLFKPIIYIALLRTKFGLKFMDYFAKKHNKFVKRTAFVFMILGYIGIFVMGGLLIYQFYVQITNPLAPSGAALVLPIPMKGVVYVPFIYWILSIFILALFHEFAHGIVARAYKIKVKSSGIAFMGIGLPIVPAAFVEPDDKKVKKAKLKAKLSIFAAGPMMNIVLGVLFLVLLNALVMPLQSNDLTFVSSLSGSAIVKLTPVKVINYTEIPDSNFTAPAKLVGLPLNSTIEEIDGVKIENFYDLKNVLDNKTPNSIVHVKADGMNYTFPLVEDPVSKKAVMGVQLDYYEKVNDLSLIFYNFLLTLVWWLAILNLGVGMFNLLPLGILDGGQMLYSSLESWFGEKKAQRIFKFVSTVFLIVLLIMIFNSFMF